MNPELRQQGWVAATLPGPPAEQSYADLVYPVRQVPLDPHAHDPVLGTTAGLHGPTRYVTQPNGTRVYCDPGDWVILFPDGFKGVMNDATFQRLFETDKAIEKWGSG